MTLSFRKILRWTVNILALVVAALTLPELGEIVPVAWLPTIGAITSIANLILSWIRSVSGGEPILKSF